MVIFEYRDRNVFIPEGVLGLNETKQTIMEKAEARFADKQKKLSDRHQATAEYMSEARARAAKTARLRALRLAKEEADRAAGVLQPPKAAVQRPPRSIRGKTLSSRIRVRGAKG
jgi:hypothetical protein